MLQKQCKVEHQAHVSAHEFKHFECVIEEIIMCVLAISGYTLTCEKQVIGGMTSRISYGSDMSCLRHLLLCGQGAQSCKVYCGGVGVLTLTSLLLQPKGPRSKIQHSHPSTSTLPLFLLFLAAFATCYAVYVKTAASRSGRSAAAKYCCAINQFNADYLHWLPPGLLNSWHTTVSAPM